MKATSIRFLTMTEGASEKSLWPSLAAESELMASNSARAKRPEGKRRGERPGAKEPKESKIEPRKARRIKRRGLFSLLSWGLSCGPSWGPSAGGRPAEAPEEIRPLKGRPGAWKSRLGSSQKADKARGHHRREKSKGWPRKARAAKIQAGQGQRARSQKRRRGAAAAGFLNKAAIRRARRRAAAPSAG
jgi:hypothetical protein